MNGERQGGIASVVLFGSLLVPRTHHLATVFRLLRSLGTGGDLTTHVQIAAHAVDYDGEVFSNDDGFGRFAGVRGVNPFAAKA